MKNVVLVANMVGGLIAGIAWQFDIKVIAIAYIVFSLLEIANYYYSIQ